MSSNQITDCGTSMIFGGPSVFNYQTAITKTFVLPPHYRVKFEFKFWRYVKMLFIDWIPGQVLIIFFLLMEPKHTRTILIFQLVHKFAVVVLMDRFIQLAKQFIIMVTVR